MALNFPNSPSLNQIYTDNTSGFSYQWNGTVWISFSPSSSSQIKTLDDFSASFNNSTQTFSLTSGGNAVTPPTPQSLIINLGGVIQDPTDDYSVAGSNITFSTAPANGLSFSGVALGPAVPVNTIPDGTVTDGSLRISTTAVVGSATTFTEDLVVSGDARVTGILTVGTSSITLNGITNVLNVGTGVTINGNTGTLTASSFVGSGSGLTGVGIGSTGSINTTGVVTASAVSANEFIGTGDKLIFSPTITSFSPTDGATGVNALSSPNIVLTYNQQVGLGTTGAITLRTVSAAGTITESFSVGVSTRATVSNQTLTIDPTSNLDYDQEYYVVVPQGSVTNYVGGNSALLNTYNFTTEAGPTLSSVSPGIGSTNVALGTDVVFTFNKNIRAGIGTITLRTVSAGGTIVESYDVASSARLTFSTNTLTIDPTSNLSVDINYYVVIPNNAVAGYAGINTYNFTTVNITNPLFAWGRNIFGQLGQNNRTYASSPVQIPGTSWSSISGGNFHLLATKTDNTLWSWGYGNNGRLGQNNITDRSSPVQIPGTTWSSISGGNKHSLATKTDNTLWSWGYNNNGQLGQNNTTQFSSPVQIPGTSWSSIESGGYHLLATKTDNTLWSWGRNEGGQLGQNNRTQFSSPVQIPGTTWSKISAGSDHSFATKTDNTLWSWGRNEGGQLGQNNRTQFSSPVQIPGTTWSSISSGNLHLLATKTDNTLWAWGLNQFGQLGQSNRTYASSPVQIPGTSWSSIESGSYHSLATQTVS